MTRSTIHAIRPSEVERAPVGVPGVILGGKYRLDEAIARGGMARVWRATHVTLNRPVAVKFVDAWGATPEERNERFLREAKVAASVRHRHVVDIIDFGTSRNGEPYMVMELLEGETLDQRLGRGPVPVDEVIEIAAQLLSGLDAVHRAGIVHRDLKPGNVFLTHDEVDGVFARLLDFGISQGADEIATESDRVVVGTPEYMSPEQAFGEPLDARSDLYAVGVVLYEMLSGVLPFEDPDPQKVVELVAHGTPAPLLSMRPDIPEICAVIARAMSPMPEARFDSAREMRRALLDAVGRGPDVTGRSSAVPRDSRVSGLQARAVATVAASGVTRSGETLAETLAPPEGPRARTRWTVMAVVLLVVVGAGAMWLAMQGGEERAAGDDAPPSAAMQAAEPSPSTAVPSTGPEEAAAAAEGDDGEASEAESTDEALPERSTRRPRRRARRATRDGEEPDPSTPSEPTIRRELDF
ncbi:serine/threonine-protein kinase [Sandaracinus amylolyticus]|uniref:Serine/threonine protein kinase PrkC, regulation of stationary phase n=1 Tax=Sandaracinus amylolyticus TaxID=927083 RepID=A0A0F6YIN1_9BACT|nr:serine/threonine-protein kinase [Sandaracinus amylolyticus]AKF06010.1 Serine/threonine protein kinase PrkC, regulation of stationary phase [Sandaracinus amylolyticus]